MNETEWLACTDPELMFTQLRSEVSSRKLRLYACAWGYELWQRMTDERSRAAVVVAERFADGLANFEELISAFNAAQEAWKEIQLVLGGRHSKRVKSPDGVLAAKNAASVARNASDPEWGFRKARNAASLPNSATRFALTNYLRDLLRNPFRAVTIEPSWLSWNDETVLKIAQQTYVEAAFDRLPILADALEEAGCTDAEILNHSRQPGTHVRGCWVVDLLLGKS